MYNRNGNKNYETIIRIEQNLSLRKFHIKLIDVWLNRENHEIHLLIGDHVILGVTSIVSVKVA